MEDRFHPCANPSCKTCDGIGIVATAFDVDEQRTTVVPASQTCFLTGHCPDCIEVEPVPYEELGVGD